MRIEIKEKELFKNLIYQNYNYKLNEVDSFCIDSRLVQKNDIFLPLVGDNIDAHKFIPQVIKSKPALIFSHEEFEDHNVIKVDSTKSIISQLAKQWIKAFKQSTIAITGSNGKTTTKEMLVNIFKTESDINYTKDNYNSTIGLPMSLFNFSLNAKINIVEMGASKPNEINFLSKIISPTYSVITNIQNAHIGNFKSFDELVNTKLALFKNTTKNGKIFENNDDINISNYCQNITNKVSFGFKNSNVDFYGKWELINSKPELTINGKNIYNNFLNKIMAKNILSSYSISRICGIKHINIIEALKNFNFANGRGRYINKNGYLIIDDTYNANFESFKIGIESFMTLKNKGRKILVVGDMKELGNESKCEHIKLGNFINEKTPDIVFSFGDEILNTIKEIKNKNIFSKHFIEKKILIDNLKSEITKGDAIYLKASRSLNFEKIIKTI